MGSKRQKILTVSLGLTGSLLISSVSSSVAIEASAGVSSTFAGAVEVSSCNTIICFVLFR